MLLGFILLLALLTACSPKTGSQSYRLTLSADSTRPAKPIDSVLAEHTKLWMKIPGVIGTGETRKDDKPAILIIVDSLTDSLRIRLPHWVEGYPVVIQETGIIRALPKK